MRKLRLDIDDLAVESFETREGAEERGTVHGHWPTQYCVSNRCSGADPITCPESLDTLCYDTCGGSCPGCSGECTWTQGAAC